MPRKNPAAWARLNKAAKSGAKKPRLQWRTVQCDAEHLCYELQALTDAKFRVFAVNTVGAELVISAYLSSWSGGEAESTDDAEPKE